MSEAALQPRATCSGPAGYTEIDWLSRRAPIVVLAPHADDESLGCGALLAAAFAGDGAHVVNVTDGRGSHPGSKNWSGDRLAGKRAEELISAVNALGGSSDDVTFLRLEDSRTPIEGPGFEAAVRDVRRICTMTGAQSLFVTSPADPHIDHRAAAAIADCVLEHLPHMRLFHYPVWSRWSLDEGKPASETGSAYRFSAKPWRAKKHAAIMAHQSQLGLLVEDDPDGFVLPDAMVRFFVEEDELFVDGGS